jgi:hypothetical protein
MAVAAAGMAAGAVIAKHFLHCRIGAIRASRFEDGPVSFLRCVQTAAVGYCLFFMAFCTDCGFAAARSGFQTGMCFFFIRGIDASMTFHTGYFAMIRLWKRFRID